VILIFLFNFISMIFNDHGTMMLGLEGLKVERYKFLLCVICQVYIYLKKFILEIILLFFLLLKELFDIEEQIVDLYKKRKVSLVGWLLTNIPLRQTF